MSRSGRINSSIVNDIVSQYQAATFWQTYASLNIDNPFTESELAEIKTFLAEMEAAADDNDKKVIAITRAGSLVAKVLKVAKIVV
jgi:hypothetical protein